MPCDIIPIIFNRLTRLFFDMLRCLAFVRTICSSCQNPKSLPPIKSDLLKISATDLAIKIRRKEVKSVEVVEAYINRIKDVNDIINAVVDERFADAINDAIKVDLMIEAADNADAFEDTKPLLGVPITVKETIAVQGLSNNGARSRISHNVAKKDAECIQLLREKGAIPILVSNTPELCLYVETKSYIGRSRNPYDSRRTTAGSSGGEAALIGSGASLIGVGSDVGGSIRIPSMFCGVYGHKPTPGFVPNAGHIPSSLDRYWDYYFTLGPMTRYAEDLALLLRCMIPEKNHPQLLRLDSHVDVSKLRIYYMYGEGPKSVLQDEPNFQVKKALKTAIDILGTSYQCITTKVDLTSFRNSFELAVLLLKTRGIENIYQRSDNPEDYDKWCVIRAMLKKATFLSNASIAAVLFGVVHGMANLLPEAVIDKLLQRVIYINNKLKELLGNDGVLIYPTFSIEAPYHDRMSGKILNISYCTLFNIIGFPVTQCHVHYTDKGLPVGVQIIAAPENDRLSIAVAEAISSVAGGWKSPDEVESTLF